ncbi:hypothetical protein XENOCAPTIV_009234 [Xenoophorus captivus]|uniref:Uncharacterized protein n=1 Tax=Xenoophorus captivus TaxID=1517983 RepID=A0ABV0R7S2_9TELE
MKTNSGGWVFLGSSLPVCLPPLTHPSFRLVCSPFILKSSQNINPYRQGRGEGDLEVKLFRFKFGAGFSNRALPPSDGTGSLSLRCPSSEGNTHTNARTHTFYVSTSKPKSPDCLSSNSKGN